MRILYDCSRSRTTCNYLAIEYYTAWLQLQGVHHCRLLLYVQEVFDQGSTRNRWLVYQGPFFLFTTSVVDCSSRESLVHHTQGMPLVAIPMLRPPWGKPMRCHRSSPLALLLLCYFERHDGNYSTTLDPNPVEIHESRYNIGRKLPTTFPRERNETHRVRTPFATRLDHVDTTIVLLHRRVPPDMVRELYYYSIAFE